MCVPGAAHDDVFMKPMNDASEYTSPVDFCAVFDKDMNALYQLAYLLTADRAMAEAVFVASLDECVSGTPVSESEARSWAKRVIIQNAIHAILLAPRKLASVQVATRSSQSATEAITRLAPFDRVVFVMSVLERVTDAECAALLRCSRRSIVETRTRALRLIALRAMLPSEKRSPAGSSQKFSHELRKQGMSPLFAASS